MVMFDSGIWAIMAGFAFVFVILLIAVYVYVALALMKIANRTKTDNAWLAWIPIANVYLMTQIAKVPGWVTLAVLLPIIPIVGSLALLVVMIWIWWKIAERRNKPGWWGILIGLIPIVNFVLIGILAWGKK